MTSSAYEIRPYRPGEEPAINSAFNQVFGRTRSLDEWRWKFGGDSGRAWAVVAVEAGGHVFAQFAAVPVLAQVDARSIEAAQVVDVFCMRRPGAVDHRVYLNAARMFLRLYGESGRVSLLYGFPNETALRLGLLRLGYGDPVAVSRMRRRLSPIRRLGIELPGWRRRFAFSSDALAQADRLWERARRRYPASIVRGSDRLRTRYRDHPAGKYLFAGAWDGDELSAWAVFEASGRVVRWVDLLWDGRDAAAIEILDERALAVARAAGADHLEIWLSGDETAASVLRARGWSAAAGDPVRVTAKSFRAELDAAELSRRMYITMGDSDLV